MSAQSPTATFLTLPISSGQGVATSASSGVSEIREEDLGSMIVQVQEENLFHQLEIGKRIVNFPAWALTGSGMVFGFGLSSIVSFLKSGTYLMHPYFSVFLIIASAFLATSTVLAKRDNKRK